MEVINSLFTIFLLVLLGIISRRAGIFSAEHVKTLSSFVYYFALPALFFVKIANLDLLSLDIHVLLVILLPILILLAILFTLNRAGVIRKDVFIVSGLSLSFGSHAFFGVAFFETLFDGKWLDLTIISASILGILGIVISLMLFEYGNKQKRSRGFLIKIVSNPLVISIVLGLIASILDVNITILKNTLDLLGRTAGGVAIFSLGIFIYDHYSLRILKNAALYAGFRSLLMPLFTWGVILASGSGNSDLNQYLLLQSGIPAAISLVVFAERYEYKIGEVAGMVILTSLLSFPLLITLYYLSRVLFP